jgi:hypothetical protein
MEEIEGKDVFYNTLDDSHFPSSLSLHTHTHTTTTTTTTTTTITLLNNHRLLKVG